MNFISFAFLGFLLAALLVYYLLPGKARWIWLLAVSLFFYLCFDARYMIFLAFSILTSYGAARLMKPDQKKQKRLVLLAAVLLNVGLLVFLKYFNYSASILNTLFERLGAPLYIYGLDLIAPIGVSFYTLQVVGYVVDVYRGNAKPERNLGKYALFVSFFPQILQGPIPRFTQLAPQLYAGRPFDYKTFKFGLQLMLWGFFKKMVIADRAAILVNQVFGGYESYAGFTLLFGALLYALQIYTDFSGCVDIARGAAEAFQIHLPHNFNQPYLATSIKDFWRRWHISLSSWLRDYVYIPLGGNRKGQLRKHLNVMATFLVSGLWHGVGLQYILWGLLHGAYQVAGALWAKLKARLSPGLGVRLGWSEAASPGARRVHRFLQVLMTFLLVDFAWIFFRSESLSAAFIFIRRMFGAFNPWVLIDGSLLALGLDGYDFWVLALSVILLLAVALMQRRFPLRERLSREALPLRWALYLAAILAVVLLGVYGVGYSASDFIYGTF